jgi:hypothetical protein
LIEQLLQTMGRHLISSYDNQRVIYVLKNGIGSIIKQGVLNDKLL